MAKARFDPHRYWGVPGWVRVVDDFGDLVCYRQAEDIRWMFKRPATPQEKDAITITLAWLEERVKVDEDTGCWVWQGFISANDQPQCRISIGPFVSATMLVRRLVARMLFQPSEKFADANAWMKNRQAGVRPTCLFGCCHPEHVSMRTKFQAMAPSRGKPIPMSQRENISRARRAKSKISDDDILKMMLDPRPGNHVAAEYNVHPTYVPHVRTGKLRKFSAVGPFTGLLGPRP